MATASATAVPAQTHQIVVFTVAGVEYALPITSVKEIIRYTEPQPTALDIPHMRGVINLRGTIVPICDLGLRLGRTSEQTVDAKAKILVMETDEGLAGAVVTTVDEVTTVASTQVEAAPSSSPAFIDAVVTIDRRLIMLLDANSLLEDI